MYLTTQHVGESDLMRMRHSRMRRRMLEGCWEQDLRQAMGRYVSAEQLAAWGTPVVSDNVFRSIVTQLSVIYDREPIIDHPNAIAAQTMREALRGAGVWTRGVQFQRLVIGQRECLRRLDVVDGALRVRIVPIDCCTLESDPDDPTEPHTVIEYRMRKPWQEGLTDKVVTRDVLSIADPAAPVYRIESEDGRIDLTEHYLGAASYSGDAYPYRRSDGTPVLPYVLTHAIDTGKLLDPYEGRELVNGSLEVAVLWSFWAHIVFDASWPQRYAVNGQPAGMDPGRGAENAGFVTTDPASLLLLQAINPDAQVSVGQWQAGGDPVKVGQAIRDREARLGQDFDIAPADIQRSHGDARSGYAILIVNQGKRDAQRKYEPQFRRADVQLMELAAVLLNRDRAANLPEDGYTIAYRGLPLSIEERRARIEEYRVRDEMGVTSAPVLLAELEGITESQARERLIQIRQDRATFGPMGR